MKHKTRTLHDEKDYAYKPQHEEIFIRVTAACDRMGGHAQIRDNYAIIDTRKFKVVAI